MSEDKHDEMGLDGVLDFGEESTADESYDMEWRDLEVALGNLLVDMDEPGQWLRLELPGATPGDGPGAPWILFFPTGQDESVMGQLPANVDLSETHRLEESASAHLGALGWGRGPVSSWLMARHASDADDIAEAAVATLRTCFGVPHPQLLTYVAEGIPEILCEQLELSSRADVPPEPAEGSDEEIPTLYVVDDRDELVAAVTEVIGELLGAEPKIDEDGDIVLSLAGQVAWVRVLPKQPAVEIFARVAHGVASRRDALVEVGLLNRQSVWVRWELRDDDVWQRVVLPAWPFAADHLLNLLAVFERALRSTRDDLVLRTQAEAA